MTIPTASRSLCLIVLGLGLSTGASEPDVAVKGETGEHPGVWVDGIGSGYVRRARFFDVEFTRGFGSVKFGGNLAHDLLLGKLRFSQSLNDVWAPERWYGGNLLFTAEFMGGMQDNPDSQYLAFGNFGLRYDLAVHSRLIPYAAASLGCGATGISAPDLSEGLQFAPQVSVGLRCFVNERFSVNLAAGYMHISNGGSKSPNAGVNSYMLSLGVGRGF